jgi:H+/Cl- antiporter ClcA
MGLGVAKSTVGATKYKVMMLVVGCFAADVAEDTLDIMHNFHLGANPTTGVLLLINIPASIVYTTYLWWLFVSLQRTRQQLILRRQTLKSELYRSFFNVLVAVGVVAGLSALYQVFVNITHDFESQWNTRWIWDAFWKFLFFLVLCIVALLWRPRKNNTRYGYSEVGADEEDDTILQLPSLAAGTLMGGLIRSRKVCLPLLSFLRSYR